MDIKLVHSVGEWALAPPPLVLVVAEVIQTRDLFGLSDRGLISHLMLPRMILHIE